VGGLPVLDPSRVVGDRGRKSRNAIEVLDGNICISATGKKEKASDVWASVKRGFVYDKGRAEYVMNDIKHPHLLLEDSRTA
jgi:hypothetical protein